jgi:glycosyltransferase involved in cell wall biosynthesis
VGLPVYNGERYLAAALDSLLAQEYRDFEILISDNGSTDGTEAICREYAARDPRIRYFREPMNRGAAWNFSRVATLAQGEYFRWACHDDLCDRRHLAMCVAALDAAPSTVVLAYTRTTLIDEDGHATRAHDDGLATVGLPPHQRFKRIAQRLGYSNILYGLLRREALAHTRLLGPYEASDYVLLAELSLVGDFIEIPEYLFMRRIHAGMSRQANRTPSAVAAWFDPRRRQRVYIPHSRLLLEYANAVRRAPLNARDRFRTALALRFWARRSIRPLAREVLAVFIPSVGAYR